MVKIQYVAVAVLAILVISAVGAIIYDKDVQTGSNASTIVPAAASPTQKISATVSQIPGATGGVSVTPAAGTTATPIPPGSGVNAENISRVTAFKALSVVDSDAAVAEWKSQRTNVSLVSITSEDCNNGLSGAWAVTYISDGEQAQVLYNNGSVSNIYGSPLHNGILLPPKMVTGSLIDSDKAGAIAMVNLTSAGKTSAGPASMELSPGARNISSWDVTYPVSGGYYMVRLNAATGQIIESTLISSA